MSLNRSHQPGNLLATVLELLGFVPHNSVVVVGLNEELRLGVLVRVDHEECGNRDTVRSMASALTQQLRSDGIRRVAIFSFQDAIASTECAAIAALRPWLTQTLTIGGEWVVAGGRYRSLGCQDPWCCPPQGLPVNASSVARENEAIAGLDAQVWGSAILSQPAGIDHLARKRAMRAFDRAQGNDRAQSDVWARTRLAEWRQAVERALDGHLPSHAMGGRLLAGLEETRVRDAVIVDLHRGQASVADRVVVGEGHELVKAAMAGLVGGVATEPDRAWLEAACLLTSYLQQLVPKGGRQWLAVAPLTVAGIAHWWLGQDQHASRCIEAARDIDEDYYLAELVEATIRAGLRPTAHRT